MGLEKLRMKLMIEKIDAKIEQTFSNPLISLSIIFLVGFLLRLYFTPFDLPSRSQDAFYFIITALSFQESFENIGGRYFMWSGLLTIIFAPFHFVNYDGYFTILRVVSITLSSFSGLVLYLIAKQMMSKKFALLSMGFFVIEPNIIENSIFGLSEPLFILLGLASFYFAIQKNPKFIVFSFVFAGLAFDTRPNGIILLIVALFSIYLRIRPRKEFIKLCIIGIACFLIVTVPLIVDFQGRLTSDLSKIISTGDQKLTPSFEHGSFISDNKYLGAIITEIIHLGRISVPYLGIFALFGFIIVLKKLNWHYKLIITTILLSLLVAIPQYTVSVEYRNLFLITPFFSLFAAIGIEHFAHDKKIKNILLVCLVLGLILVSFIFLSDRQPDPELILEQERFGKFVVSSYEGRITTGNWNYILHNLSYPLSDSPLVLKIPNFVIHDRDELVEYIVTNKIDYIVIDKEDQIRFAIFPDIYFNEEKYPFLKKVFDSDFNDYQKYRVKIFEVNYNKFE